MMPALLENDRLAELLVQQATEGLNASETLELRGLLSHHGRPDPEIIERTAAAVLLAGTIEPEPLPVGLRRKLDLAAEAFVAGQLAKPATGLEAGVGPRAQTVDADRRSHLSPVAWFAAAAGMLLALLAWWPRLQVPDEGANIARGPAVVEPSPYRARQDLLDDHGALQTEWKGTEDPAASGVSGDVVWDNDLQAGFMRFRGLPPNEPSRTQYQLWIFDASRGDQYPVDGGVFDVPAGAEEVVVPINAKLRVYDPQLFAVTVEKAGGVVVSSRERIVVVATTTAG